VYAEYLGMERTLTTVVYDEHSVPELGTNITSWSEVLRPPWMLFFVIEAAKVNKQADFEGLRVYGLLTNLNRFALYSYNPVSSMFCRDDEIFVGTLRDSFSSGMIHGVCLVS
jgi:hypothetical protein